MSELWPSQNELSTIQVKFNGQPIIIEGDLIWDMELVNDLARTVTSMDVDADTNAHGSVGVPRVTYVCSDEISIDYDDSKATIAVAGPRKNFGQGPALVYLAEYLAANKLAANEGNFLTHAAAVYDPESDRSQVLLGEKGAGKTTLSVRLCSEGGLELIGNDQIYLGSNEQEIYTSSGNTWFNIRRTATESDEYMRRFGETHLSHRGSRPSWNDKIRLEPEEIGIKRRLGAAIVQDIFHIRLDPTQETLYVAPWSGIQQNLVLHERFGRHISGQATPFQDDNGNYLGSLPLIDYHASSRQRDKLVRKIIAKGVTELFAPNSEVAYKYILEQKV